MESARINPKNPQGDYLLRPTYDLLDQIRLLLSMKFCKKRGREGEGRGRGYAITKRACTKGSNLRMTKTKVTDKMYEIIVVYLGNVFSHCPRKILRKTFL